MAGILTGSTLTQDLHVRRGMFAGPRTPVYATISLSEAGDADLASILSVTRQGGEANGRSAVLRRISDDLVVVGLRHGSLDVTVGRDGLTTTQVGGSAGLYHELQVALLGDVDGNFRVDRNDLNAIRGLQGTVLGDSRYDTAADLNGDGRVNAVDLRWARSNLGASTSIRPLDIDADLQPESDPNGDGLVASASALAGGVTRAGSTVSVDENSDGTPERTIEADTAGRFATAVALASGGNAIQFGVSDAFGQVALNTVRATRVAGGEQGGVLIQSPNQLVDFYQSFDGPNKSTVTIGGTSLKSQPNVYSVPGTDPQFASSPNVNEPLLVNSSSTFNQPVQSNDWWSNLMFRYDPVTVSTPLNPGVESTIRYSSTPMWSQPSAMSLIDSALGSLNPMRGVNVFNPTVTYNVTVPDSESTSEFPILATPTFSPSVIFTVDGLAPYQNSPGQGTGELFARVNSYSDWGVEFAYSNSTDSVTVDAIAGSPFTYFTKTGSSPVRIAATGTANGQNVVYSTFDTGSPATLGIKLTQTLGDAVTGQVIQTQVGYYLVTAIAPNNPTWSVTNTDNLSYAILTSSVTSGQFVVTALPPTIGGQSFDSLSAADKQAVAQYFIGFAGNVPTNTQVSDPTQAYNPATGTVTSTLSVTTTGGPTLQVVYPHQWRNLVSADRGNTLITIPGLSIAGPLELTWPTTMGTAKLYAGNSFTTELDYRGILPSLPPLAVADAGTAQTLYNYLASWYQYRFNLPITSPQTPALGSLAGPMLNTYALEFTQITDTILLATQLVSDASPLSATQKADVTRARDWLLDSVRTLMGTYFDIASGKLFQLNQTYDTVIGYPDGYGSALNLNDHHFHYGYFLNGFANLVEIDPDFVNMYENAISYLVADVANSDRTRTDLPFLRNFSPWAGHSYADGLGQGGNNEESSSEAMQFAQGLTRLGEFFGRADWRNLGVYLHTTEAESIQNYWFNSYAYDDEGNFDANDSNWPASFVQQNANGIDGVTQLTVVRQNITTQANLFGTKVDGRYAINWVPGNAAALYLVSDNAYATLNWKQFARDYQFNGLASQGIYELATSIYQAMIGADGTTGVLAPGSAGALARIAAFPAANGNRYEDGYLGTSVPLAASFVSNLGQLGTYDSTIQANTPYYGVFKNAQGQRTYVIYVPQSALEPATSVVFRDPTGAVVATKPISGPGLYTFVSDSTTPRIDLLQPLSVAPKGALFLKSDANGGSLTLSPTAGTTVPDNSQTYAVPSLTPYTQPGQFTTFVNVPARATSDGNNNSRPASASQILTFDSGPILGTYDATEGGGATVFDLFLNQFLEPGVIQNLKSGGHNMMIRVLYNPSTTDPTQADRIEDYTAIVDNNNRYAVVNQNSSVVPLAPVGNFPQKLQRVRIEVWGGAYPSDPAFIPYTNRPVAVSVNTPGGLGRASWLSVPYDLQG